MDCTPKCRLSLHADVVLSAVTRESLEDVQHFMKCFCGNGIQAKDNFGRNALHIAASCGRKDVLKWLLEEKLLDVHERDVESGWTALHRACYYGQLACALLLLQHGANIYEKDFEGLSSYELLMCDCPRLPLSPSGDAHLDVYSWGRNSNFTLGHGDDKERNTPEVVDAFTRILHVSIKEVVICEFHAVFLAHNGSVWTCGHGLGGRLGHGDEKTILVPKQIDSVSGQVCIGIAAGQDHTVVLCENGNVLTFGLNKYHQMGHHPPDTQYLTPKLVQTKNLKGKRFIGVAAGKFHTLIFTETEVYSWGLNAGQLGHIKGDRTQMTPRQISGLHLKDTSILTVSCCDSAIVCLTSHGDVYLAYQYTIRKIISKLPNISKLVVTGGQLDSTYFKETKHVKHSPLTIYGLYGDGYVFLWRESDKYLRDCRWTIQKPLSVRDIACGKSLHIVTDQGEVYTEDGSTASEKKPSKISARNENVIKTNRALKQDEVIEIPLNRVRHTHRAVRIIADKNSQNLAILQVDPSSGCSIIPDVSPREMTNHMKTLFEDLAENHDVEIKVKGKTLYAHQAVLAQGSEMFRALINDSKQELCSANGGYQTPIIYLDEDDFEIVNESIEFLYTGSCASLPVLSYDNCEVSHERELTDEDILNELTLSLQDVDFDVLNTAYPESQPVKQEKKSTRSKKKRKDGESLERKDSGELSRKKKDGESLEIEDSGELSRKKKELLRIAKKYQINELIARFQESSDNSRKKQKCFHRSKLLEYCDVVIEAEDGTEFSCHKCILVSRLEYFSVMLTTGWMESSEAFVRLKMPIPSRILKVIIEFLYTDEAPSLKDSRDLEFLGNVLTVADQLWIVRLREICEASLASLISLKNAVEMLEFSFLYNAEKLKRVCLQFICMNISCLFEARALEMLSEDVLDEVTKAYREMIPYVSWRVITPNDIHLSVPWPQQIESPSKRKSSRSQRRSRTSESDVTKDNATQSNETEITEPAAKEKIEADEKLPEIKQANSDECARALAPESKSKPCLSPDVSRSKTHSANVNDAGVWYQKSGKKREEIVSPSLTTRKQSTNNTASSPLPIQSRKNSEPEEVQPWGSPSPQSSADLRAIMEQEELRKKIQIDKPKKEGKSPGKSRLSQKERKKMQRSLEEQDLSFNKTSEPVHNGHDIAASPVNPWNNFSPKSRPVSVSFRELLEEEESLRTNVSIPRKKTTTVKEIVAEEKSPPTSAWQHKNMSCSPPDRSNMKFDKIQELQEQETANRERDMKKPLSLIQIEDKAIEELLEHYGGKYNPCEYIVVERQARKTDSPDWVK